MLNVYYKSIYILLYYIYIHIHIILRYNTRDNGQKTNNFMGKNHLNVRGRSCYTICYTTGPEQHVVYIYAAWIAEVHQTQKYISSAAEPMVRAHTAYA